MKKNYIMPKTFSSHGPLATGAHSGRSGGHHGGWGRRGYGHHGGWGRHGYGWGRRGYGWGSPWNYSVPYYGWTSPYYTTGTIIEQPTVYGTCSCSNLGGPMFDGCNKANGFGMFCMNNGGCYCRRSIDGAKGCGNTTDGMCIN